MRNKKIIALLLAFSFVFAGCNKYEQSKDTKTEESSKQTQTQEKTEGQIDENNSEDIAIKLPETKITLKAASYKFENHVGGAPYQLTEVSFDIEDGNPIYEFEGNKNGEEYSLKVNANTADTTEAESDKADDSKKEIDLGKAIPPEEAMRIVLEENKGGSVKEWTLTNDGSDTKYEIELEDGKKIMVNAISKEIIK